MPANNKETQSTPSALVASPQSLPDHPAENLDINASRLPLLGPGSLVTDPAPLPGVRAWTIETKAPRSHIEQIRFAPNGAFVMVPSWDGAVRLFDTHGHLLRILLGSHATHVNSTISADSKYVATAGEDDILCVWDAQTGSRVNSYSISGWRASAAGRMLELNEPNLCEIDLPTGSRRTLCQVPPYFDFSRSAVDQDGSHVAVGEADSDTIDVFEIAGGRTVASIACGDRNVFFVLAHDRLITYREQSLPLRLWDVKTGLLVAQLDDGTASHRTPSFTPDGSRIVADINGRGHMWDAVTGKELNPAWGKGFPLGNSPAFSPDGKTLVSAGNNNLYWGDADRGVVSTTVPTAGSSGFFALLLSPMHDRVVRGAWADSFLCWRFAPPQATSDPRITCSTIFAPGGTMKLAASTDGSVMISDSNNGRLKIWETTHWRQHADVPNQSYFQALCASPDASLAADATGNNHVRVVDLRSGIVVFENLDLPTRVCAMTFDRNGQRLAIGCEDGAIHILDPRSGQQIKTLRLANAVEALAFAADGARLATIDADGKVAVFDTAMGDAHLWQSLHPSSSPTHGRSPAKYARLPGRQTNARSSPSVPPPRAVGMQMTGASSPSLPSVHSLVMPTSQIGWPRTLRSRLRTPTQCFASGTPTPVAI